MKFWIVEPLHAVPSATNEMRSYLEAAAVMVGAVAAVHFTPVKVAVYPPAPVRILSMKLFPAVAAGMVKTQLPVRVQVWNVPEVRARVWAVPLLPMATTPSVGLMMVPLVAGRALVARVPCAAVA